MDVSDSLLFYYSVCLCNVVLPKITIVGFIYCVFRHTEVRQHLRDRVQKERDIPEGGEEHGRGRSVC